MIFQGKYMISLGKIYSKECKILPYDDLGFSVFPRPPPFIKIIPRGGGKGYDSEKYTPLLYLSIDAFVCFRIFQLTF